MEEVLFCELQKILFIRVDSAAPTTNIMEGGQPNQGGPDEIEKLKQQIHQLEQKCANQQVIITRQQKRIRATVEFCQQFIATAQNEEVDATSGPMLENGGANLVNQKSVCDGVSCQNTIRDLEAKLQGQGECCTHICDSKVCQTKIKNLEDKMAEKQQVNEELVQEKIRRTQLHHKELETLKTQNHHLEGQLAKLKAERNSSDSAVIIRSLEDELHRLRKIIAPLDEDMDKLKLDNADLMQKLSKEWSQKISSNESNIENINIKNRPMNLGNDFEQMFSNEWLDVKTDMDDTHQGNEEAKHKLLCAVMLEAQDAAQLRYKEVQKCVEDELLYPFTKHHTVSNSTQTEVVVLHNDQSRANADTPMEIDTEQQSQARNEPSDSMAASTLCSAQDSHDEANQKNDDTQIIPGDTESGSVSLPRHLNLILKNTLRDILRVNADNVRLTSMFERVNGFAMERIPSVMPLETWNSSSMDSYVQACCRLTWSMALQSPAMVLETPGVRSKWNEKIQDAFYGSDDPSQSGAVVCYYVQPALTHSGRVMVKGKIMAKTITSEASDAQCAELVGAASEETPKSEIEENQQNQCVLGKEVD